MPVISERTIRDTRRARTVTVTLEQVNELDYRIEASTGFVAHGVYASPSDAQKVADKVLSSFRTRGAGPRRVAGRRPVQHPLGRGCRKFGCQCAGFVPLAGQHSVTCIPTDADRSFGKSTVTRWAVACTLCPSAPCQDCPPDPQEVRMARIFDRTPAPRWHLPGACGIHEEAVEAIRASHHHPVHPRVALDWWITKHAHLPLSELTEDQQEQNRAAFAAVKSAKEGPDQWAP